MNKSTITLIMLLVSISFSQVNTTYYDGTECQCDSIKSEYYNESGQLFSETPYKNNFKNGIKKSYGKSGQVSLETPYKNGLLQGIEMGYNESGQLIFVTGYNNNFIIFITSLY